VHKRTKKRRKCQLEPLSEHEIMAAVSPLALFALVGLTFDLLDLTVRIPAIVLQAVMGHVAGLFVLSRKPSAVKVAELLGALSHDQLTRLVYGERWTAHAIMLAFVALVNALGIPGYLVIDDTHIPRPRGRKVEGAYWDWDHALRRNMLGYRMVVVLWVAGPWMIPLAFSFWHKKGARPKYRTKNEIARTLLRWTVRRVGKAQYVTFDAWYANKKMFKMCEKLGLEWFTRVKKNTKLNWNGKRLRADTIGRRLLKASRLYRRSVVSGGVARKAVVRWGEQGPFAFVVLRDEIDGECSAIRYLLASTPGPNAAAIALRYKSRWQIEVFFETLKQHFWLSAYQGRTLRGEQAYVALSFLAGVCAQYWAATKTNASLAEVKDWASRLLLVTDKKGETHLTLVRPLPADCLDGIEQAKAIVKKELPKLLQLASPLRKVDSAA